MQGFSGDQFGEVTSDFDVALRWVYENSLGDKVLNGFQEDQLRLQDVLEASADDLLLQAQDWKLGAMATRRFLNAVARLRQEFSDAHAEKGAVMVLVAEKTHDNGNANHVPVFHARPSVETNDVTQDEGDTDVSMSRSMTPSLNDSVTVSAMSQSDLSSQLPSSCNSSNNSNHWSITRSHKIAVKSNLQKNGGKDERKNRLRTRYCNDFFSTGGCKYGDKCKYAHSVFEKVIVRRRGRGGRGNGRSSRDSRTYKQQ